MIKKMSCPFCEKTQEVHLVSFDEMVIIKGMCVYFTARSYRCSVCKEIFDTAKTLDDNLIEARANYNEIMKGLH